MTTVIDGWTFLEGGGSCAAFKYFIGNVTEIEVCKDCLTLTDEEHRYTVDIDVAVFAELLRRAGWEAKEPKIRINLADLDTEILEYVGSRKGTSVPDLLTAFTGDGVDEFSIRRAMQLMLSGHKLKLDDNMHLRVRGWEVKEPTR